jgi:Tfp pilus assembly protein PilF
MMRPAFFCLVILAIICHPASAYTSDAVRFFEEGNALLTAGDYQGAIGAYDKAIALEPEYFEAWNGMADAYNRASRYGDALEASNRSITINPGYTKGWINRGQILYSIGYQYEDVEKNLPLADTLYAAQLDAYERAIATDPADAEAWFNKGYALCGMKRYDEGISAFDKVAELDPAYPKLEANRKIAVKLRDASATASPGNNFLLIGGAALILVILFVAGFLIRRRKAGQKKSEAVNRKSRRRERKK